MSRLTEDRLKEAEYYALNKGFTHQSHPEEMILNLIAEVRALRVRVAELDAMIDELGGAAEKEVTIRELTRLIGEADSIFSLCWHRGHTSGNAPHDLKLQVEKCLGELRRRESRC